MLMFMQSMGMAPPESLMEMDMEKTMLVQKVKELQRLEGRDKWEAFVAEKGGWQKDPTLRSTSELKEFLGPETCEVLKLVQKVKTGQRISDEFKEAWWAYCEKEKND